MKVLILGGTGAASTLATRLVAHQGVDVVTSLAGATMAPRLPPGAVRAGGFGGIPGLAGYLKDEAIDRVVDATHPFAVEISAHAVAACAQRAIGLLILARPPWTPVPGDSWHRVPTVASAAASLADYPPGNVLITTGRRELSAFAHDDRHRYVVRTVDPPAVTASGPVPARMTLLLARGPYTAEDERSLMTGHRVTVVVTKDSGGAATAAKLVAARHLGLPVVMVDRPPTRWGIPCTTSIEEAARWARCAPGPDEHDAATTQWRPVRS